MTFSGFTIRKMQISASVVYAVVVVFVEIEFVHKQRSTKLMLRRSS